MATYNLKINGQTKQVDVDPATPMLWVLREHLNMPGTKYGCGVAMCGACTIHVNGTAVRSCQLPVSQLEPRRSQPLKVFRQMATILFRKHGLSMMWPSVVIVKRVRS